MFREYNPNVRTRRKKHRNSVGRRPLFLVSSITSTVALLLIALSFFLEWSAVPTLVVLCAFMFCFSIGLGPLTFVVAAEVSLFW